MSEAPSLGPAAPPTPPVPLRDSGQAPSIRRRLASFLYEGVLLFGIVMAVGLVYSLTTNQRHALAGALGLKASLFAILGLYFVYFWSRHGQTLAMKTWHLKVIDGTHRPPGPWRAAARYLLAWLWFLPALATLGGAGLTGGGAFATLLVTGVLAYAALARLRSDRQFLHDVICGTRLVDARAAHGATPLR